jgi:hypothetical protein
VTLYLTVHYVSYYFRYDGLAKIVATVVIVASASELYGYSINYRAPEIYWYIWIMISNLLVRFLVFPESVLWTNITLTQQSQ